MGRYYSGDIEGKFWFAVQSSTDPSFFGGSENDPNLINYYFTDADKSDIEEGIAKCKEALGEHQKKLDDFFVAHNGYNDEMLIEAGFPKAKVQELLQWYARLELGEKILKCVQDNGSCSFTAET
jgi:hypothetical protein